MTSSRAKETCWAGRLRTTPKVVNNPITLDDLPEDSDDDSYDPDADTDEEQETVNTILLVPPRKKPRLVHCITESSPVLGGGGLQASVQRPVDDVPGNDQIVERVPLNEKTEQTVELPCGLGTVLAVPLVQAVEHVN